MTSLTDEKIKTMDGFILLSIVNMALRDKYNDLDALCYDMNITKEVLNEKLDNIGYKFDEKYNKYY